MKLIDFENTFDAGLFDQEYMDYILEHANPNDRIIHNGDSLLQAFEEMYLYEEFKQSKLQ